VERSSSFPSLSFLSFGDVESAPPLFLSLRGRVTLFPFPLPRKASSGHFFLLLQFLEGGLPFPVEAVSFLPSPIRV